MPVCCRHVEEAVAAVLVDGCGEDCVGGGGEGVGEEVDGGFQVCGLAEAGEVEEVVDLIEGEGWKRCRGHFGG